MRRFIPYLPSLITVLAVAALLLHGPILQPADYHAFADTRPLFGLPNAADVLSNLGFLAVGLWGFIKLWPLRQHPAMAAGWPGYSLFLGGLILTALGSGFYHAAPDDWRLVWDRMPIALACAGLLAAVRAESMPHTSRHGTVAVLAAAAIASVAWWYGTGASASGDLRPYLLLQGLPLLLIPIWQWIYRWPFRDRMAFGAAILLYVAAKAAEVNDRDLLAALGWISGHTIKHLLATAAAGILVGRLAQRDDQSR